MSAILRALSALVGARKGFRWSLYFVHESEGLKYALHENAVSLLLGYPLAKFEDGNRLRAEWTLHINFNWKHKSIKLEDSHFQHENISPELLQKIASIDPGWMVPGSKPMFMEVATGKELPLGWAYAASFESETDLHSSLLAKLTPKRSRDVTLQSVMNDVFEKAP